MAGDWIKMRSNLWDDPRIACLVEKTDTCEAAVIGGLYWLWATADQHSEDGVMPGMTPRTIDRKTGVRGLGESLVAIGWIEDHPEGLHIVRFDEHNGTSAKKRAVTAKRVANHRGNADVTQEALQDDESVVTDALARERVREEKEKEKPEGTKTVSAPAAEISESKAPTRAADLSKAMRESSIEASPSDPRIQALAEQGVSADTVRAAAIEARADKPNEQIKPGYVIAIVERWAKDAARMKTSGATSPAGHGLNKQEALEARNRAIALELAAEHSHAAH